MLKKALFMLASVMLLFAVNLKISCRVSVAGELLDGLYSPAAIDAGTAAAAAAADEILRDDGAPAELKQSYTLSLRPPTGSSQQIADALLRATEGVAAVNGVFVDEIRMGVVVDEDELREELDRFIYMQQPTKAVRSILNGTLRIEPFYGRGGTEVSCEDMVLLITGKAHVMYMDENGKFV